MARKPHHPPDPGRYAPPNDDTPGYLMGENAVAGFGSPRLFVAAIPRRDAVETITSNHYSGRVVNNSYVHLGVYLAGEYVGAMQFGYMLNPHRAGRIVAGTHTHEYLELNRMWLSDAAPRNTESQALSCAIKYIRRALPRINWIQSYADERCGGCGIVYQACGFLYLGCHKTRFLELDGEWYHEMLLTAHKQNGQRGKYLIRNRHRARSHIYRQFRYIRLLKPRCRKYLRFPILPYPKPAQLQPINAARR